VLITNQVHPLQISKVTFSSFVKEKSGPQYLRLASTSLGNTISVETFTATEISVGTAKSRHVIQTARTRQLYATATYLVIAMVVAAVALMIQSLLDPEGVVTRGLVPAQFRNYAGKTFGEAHRAKRHEAVLNNANTPAVQVERRIRDLLHLHNPPLGSASPQTEKALVIHHDPETGDALSTEVHDGHESVLKKHTEARRWDDLSMEEQMQWKQKLSDAGMWAVGEGETILKSIFFGQIGGLVGQVAQAALG
jgi:prolactin regulatory element-binding protein